MCDASTQEKLLRMASANNFGAACVYRTEPYRKGNAIRELADLVWLGNRCVVFLWMTDVEEAVDADRHNLKQMSGGLRAWRNGQRIKVTNAFDTREIKHEQESPIVAISVSRAADAQSRVDREMANRINATVCAHLTERVFCSLMTRRHTLSDLLIVLQLIAEQGPNPLCDDEILKLVEKYRLNAELQAEAMVKRSFGGVPVTAGEGTLIEKIWRLILCVRIGEGSDGQKRSSFQGNAIIRHRLNLVLNDLTYAAMQAILKLFEQLFGIIRHLPGTPASSAFDIDGYHFAGCIAKAFGFRWTHGRPACGSEDCRRRWLPWHHAVTFRRYSTICGIRTTFAKQTMRDYFSDSGCTCSLKGVVKHDAAVEEEIQLRLEAIYRHAHPLRSTHAPAQSKTRAEKAAAAFPCANSPQTKAETCIFLPARGNLRRFRFPESCSFVSYFPVV